MSKTVKNYSAAIFMPATAAEEKVAEKNSLSVYSATNLSDWPFLFVDCQTTGATPDRAHLLEVGWTVAKASDTEAPKIITRLISLPAEESLPPRIQKLTGISEADMAEAVSAEIVINEIQNDLTAHGLSHAVAHWAQFEKTFLTHYFEQFAPSGRFDADFICTCQIAKRLYPDLPSRAIRAVGGYFGLSVDEMKRAQGHVEITFFIWQNLVRELEQMGINNAPDLQQWLAIKEKSVSRVKNNDGSPAESARSGAAAKFLLPLEPLSRLDLPDQPGVYRLLNSKGKILYVGKATSLKSRVNSYFTGRKGKDSKTKELISQVFDLHVSPLATPLEAALLENDLIKEHDPPYNRALKKRGRTLVYFSRDFASVSAIPDQKHILGPFPRGSTIEPLILLHQGLATNSFDPGLFWGLLDPPSIDRAITLFFAEYFDLDIKNQSSSTNSISFRQLLALGMAFHRRQLLDSLQADTRGLSLTYFIGPKAAEADDEEDALLDDTESGGLSIQGESESSADESIVELTDEDLVLMVRSLVTGAARAYAMARTLTRLLDVTILYEEKKQRRRLIFVSGLLHLSADLDCLKVAEQAPVPQFKPAARKHLNSPIDLVTYDRMRILLAEVRRVYARGNWISVTEAQI